MVERPTGKQYREKYNCGQIPKPLCFGRETCAHFRMVNNMRIKRNCKKKSIIIKGIGDR